MLPAYIPNPVAAAVGGGRPVDGGMVWRDGRRVLGDGKTIRGFAGGVLCGCLVGIIQIWLHDIPAFSFLPELRIIPVFLLATGALLGDMVKSFFKRRAGIERGGEWLLADQYDFVLGAWILTAVGAPSFVFSTLTLPIILVILIITPVLHRLVNIIGYKLGVKDVPW